MGFIAWIVVGLIAGWLAGQVMKGDRFDHRGICWRGDFGLDYPLIEKSLKKIFEK